MSRRYFSPDLFAFLGDLADNNNRAWFNEHKARYEASVRQPALDFITDFVEPLEGLSPYFVADSRTVGGSLFRIHRDTRFAKDKTPYKLNT
ncbi:MAG: TIGR02453 family protein, partial [Acidimicrobiales bacterium]